MAKPKVTALNYKSSIKGLRETLCVAQTSISELNAMGAIHWDVALHNKRIQQLIDEIDRHRPLGSDGALG
jgi:hypothetical protein